MRHYFVQELVIHTDIIQEGCIKVKYLDKSIRDTPYLYDVRIPTRQEKDMDIAVNVLVWGWLTFMVYLGLTTKVPQDSTLGE